MVLGLRRIANDVVRDPAIVHQVVGDGLDETRVRLRMRVGIFGFKQLAGFGNDQVTVDVDHRPQRGEERPRPERSLRRILRRRRNLWAKSRWRLLKMGTQ